MQAELSPGREPRRAERVARIPASYSPALHMILPSLFGAAFLALALWGVRDLRAVELLVVPLTFLSGFGFEWRVHQILLHRRTPPFSTLYERHELSHHVIYTDDDLAMRSPREMWFILMPPYAVPIVFATVVPFAVGLAWLATENAARLMVATSMIFFLTYEWLHLAYHQPPESRVGRTWPIPRLREVHRIHHDPRLMKRWNFNVTVPLFDWLHGTLWSPEREAQRDIDRHLAASRAARR
jgi:hypothetical protein